MDMYFIAVLAPAPVERQVLQWKIYMRDRHGCAAALKSPAHITLVPPFWMDPSLEQGLKNGLDLYSAAQDPFEIRLNGFGSFPPRVIYVSVEWSNELIRMQGELPGDLTVTGPFPIKRELRPFHPHLTIAARDLFKKSYAEAWEFFKTKNYKAEWMAGGISLLRHNKKNWDVVYTSQFKKG